MVKEMFCACVCVFLTFIKGHREPRSTMLSWKHPLCPASCAVYEHHMLLVNNRKKYGFLNHLWQVYSTLPSLCAACLSFCVCSCAKTHINPNKHTHSVKSIHWLIGRTVMEVLVKKQGWRQDGGITNCVRGIVKPIAQTHTLGTFAVCVVNYTDVWQRCKWTARFPRHDLKLLNKLNERDFIHNRFEEMFSNLLG